jgi:hypothetical protein
LFLSRADMANGAASPAGDKVAVGFQQPDHAAAHCAQADKRDAQRGMAVQIGHDLRSPYGWHKGALIAANAPLSK